MAFAMSNNSAFGNSAQTRIGPELPEVSTEGFGFQTIAGQSKLRLLPAPWPTDNLPPPTASLLSVASKKGLLVGAGPESVVIASMDLVRQAYNESSGDGEVKSFTPQFSLNLGMRVSHVAFSADENFLVLSAQSGGGLAVYEVANLMNGMSQSSFEMSTNGMTLRHVIPNPTAEKAELFALVTEAGHLLMANLKTRELISREQNPIMKEGVSCISWSNKGKQVVAGLGNGTCSQMTPEGEEKATIPRPTNLEGDQHVSSISWLENDIFLVAYTPTFHDGGMPPTSDYYIINRVKAPQQEIVFQKLPEPCFPAGLDRAIPYQFFLRLREFPPNLADAIFVASTGSEDIGLIARSKTQLSSDRPAGQENTFTTMTMADDSRRAQMPMSEDLQSTSPIGIALDLSSKDKVPRPLPKEEFDDSAGPLPALVVLNNEGLLMTWWFVYADSIRQRTSFPGLAALGGIPARQTPEAQRQASPFASTGQQSSAPALGRATFGQPSTSTFGSTSSTSAFGVPSNPASTSAATPAFGNRASPWSSASNAAPAGPAFGRPVFGSATPPAANPLAPAFGQAGGLTRSSPWGSAQTGSATASGSAFGQTGNLNTRSNPFGGSSSASPFGTATAPTSSTAPSGGFASFASTSSAFLNTPSAPTSSVFGKPSSKAPTGAPSLPTTGGSPFGQLSNKTEAPKPLFGGTSGFTLGSTFKGDGTASNDAPKPAANTGSSMFGSNFGDVLGKAGTEGSQAKDADMEDETETVAQEKPQEQKPSLPVTKSSEPTESPKPTTPPKYSGLFGTQSQSSTTPANVGSSKPAAGWSFGKLKPDAITPKEIHMSGKDPSGKPSSPKIKTEPEGSDDEKSQSLSDVPLPPESTSKTTFAPGDSSNSSKSSNEEPAEPPLPPDPFPVKSKLSNVESATAEPPLPPDPSPTPATRKAKEPSSDSLPKLSDDREDAQSDEDEETDEDDDGDEVGEEDGDEADGDDEAADDESSSVDAAQELTSPSDHTQSPKVSPEKSLTSQKGSKSNNSFSKWPTQNPEAEGPPLFGEVDKKSTVFGKPSVPFFPAPSKPQQSPRSPSPIRQSQFSFDALRPDNSRSVSAPGLNNAIANRKAAPASQSVFAPKQTPISAIELRKQNEQKLAADQARRIAEEEQSLSDEEDELNRRELETPVTGSRKLQPFVAHQDYVGNVDKSGIPGQIEKVYRDINSMVDTLGLNARSIAAFVKGHSEQIEDGGISVDDLDETDQIALDEIPKLIALESNLSADLESHRLKDAHEHLSNCRDIRKDIQSFHHKRNDITKTIESIKESKSAESALSAPLSLEQASQQHDLRKRVAHFQKLLAQAEGDITMLRAKIASSNKPGNGSASGLPVQKKPTVEAVTKTILKMTSMIEKKSGDIDVLEAQMRSLRLPSIENGLSVSREGSPFASSKLGKGNVNQRSPLGKSYRNGFTTAASSHSSTPLRVSLNGVERTEKESSDLLEEEQALSYGLKVQRRKEVNKMMREVFEKSGPRRTPLD